MHENPLLAAALEYAARGWLVVPLHSVDDEGVCTCSDETACRSPGKHPRLQHGLKEASSDPNQIRVWWQRWPAANVGIVTGAASGIVVLDVDPKSDGPANLRALVEEHGGWITVTAVTGSGGMHALFRHPGTAIRNSASKVARGVDVRGDGGYIVAPPSLHASGASYAWAAERSPADVELAEMPDWLLAMATATRKKEPSAPRPTVELPSDTRLKRARAWLSRRAPAIEGSGGDQHTFTTAAELRGFGLSEDETYALLVNEWNDRCSPPWAPEDLREKVRNAYRYASGVPGEKLAERQLPERPHRVARTATAPVLDPANDPEPPQEPDAHAEALAFLERLPRMIEQDPRAPLLPESVAHLARLLGTPDWLRAKAILRGARCLQEATAAAKAHKRRAAFRVVSAGDQQPLTKSYASLCTMLRDPVLRAQILDGELEFCEMGQTPTIARERVEDHHVSALQERIERTFSDGEGRAIRPNIQDLHRAVDQVAHERPYHPVREYLDTLSWDGVPRIDRLLAAVLGAPDSALNRLLVRRWLISAVARVYRPGCKADGVLILQGKQGGGKSGFFAALGGEWFSDAAIDMGKAADAALAASNHWIIELAELAALNKRDLETTKAFLTRQIDDVRLPYGKRMIRLPRMCIFGGTSNPEEILRDPTGNRRFWIIPAGEEIQLDVLRSWRDQIWAEAVAAFRSGERWHLDYDEQGQLAEAQRAFEEVDVWTEPILSWVSTRILAPPTTGEILESALDKPRGQHSRADEMRVAAILRRAGYRKEKRTIGGDRAPRWVRV